MITQFEAAEIVLDSHNCPKTLAYLRELKASHDALLASLILCRDFFNVTKNKGRVTDNDRAEHYNAARRAITNAEKLS